MLLIKKIELLEKLKFASYNGAYPPPVFSRVPKKLLGFFVD